MTHLMASISCNNAAASSEDDATISCISNGLYVGNYNSVSNVVVKKFNISSIVIAASNITVEPDMTKNVDKILLLGLDESPNEEIESKLINGAQFVNLALTNGNNVLVACMFGMNRSVSVILTYLIIYKKMSYNAAFELVKTQRSIICPMQRYIDAIINCTTRVTDDVMNAGGFDQGVASATPISATSVTTQCVTKITARAKLRLRFPNRTRLFFPVIHICGKSPTHIPTTIAAVHVAVDNGADGIFLIPAFAYDSTEDGLADSTVDDTLAAVRQEFGNDLFVGLNYFVGDTKSFVDRVPGNTVDALWHDYGVGRSVEDDCAYDESLQAAALASVENSWTGFLFAGFFFKGKDHSLLEDEASMKQSESPAVTYGEETCRLVQEAARGLESRVEKAAFHLVFNASGPGTSRPIEAPRPLCFRTEIGVEGVMSVASGVDASNVTEVLPHIDVYLVASGIEQVSTDAAMVEFYKEAKMGLPVNLGYLDPVKVRELADLIHGFDART